MLLLHASLILACISVAAGLSGCGSSVRYPSVAESPTRVYNPGQVVWRDLITPDTRKSADFYKKVFGWTVEKVNSGETPYWIFMNNGKRVAGMFELTEGRSGAGGEWISYMSVPSVEKAVEKISSAGGTVLKGPVEIEGRGNVVLLSDAQRAVFAAIRSEGGDPKVKEASDDEWLWSELWANDPAASGQFYSDLIGGNITDKSVDSISYRLIEKNGRRCAGIIKTPAQNARSYWVQYIKVSDIKETVRKAKEAGGKVLIEPNEKIRKGNVALLMDPAGAPVAVQVWPYQ